MQNTDKTLLKYAAVAVVIVVAVVMGLLIIDRAGYFKHGVDTKNMTVPGTEEFINAMVEYNPGNAPMYRSTITFADMTCKLKASYEPYENYMIEFEGIGISSTEVQYEFDVILRWEDNNWKVLIINKWDMVPYEKGD